MRFSDATREIVPAIIGAGGVVGLNYVMQVLPIPASMQTGMTGYAVEFAGALGLGLVAGMVAGKKVGTAVAMGGMVVVTVEFVNDLMSGNLTGTGSGAMARFVPGTPIAGGMGRLGYQSPAKIVQYPQRGVAALPVYRGGTGLRRFVPMR